MGPARAMIVAIVGAESSGKTTLARALAARIGAETGLSTVAVPEFLREWCDAAGRTPRPDEQAAIAAEQQRRIDAAAAAHDVVVADTTPLMIAVYSLMLFGDASLVPMAIEAQRRCDLTLLTALDLPWVADGLQRDGPHVREPVDTHLRALLDGHAIAYATIGGAGDARVGHALDAASPLLMRLAPTDSGLFTRLARREAAAPAWQWVCDSCDVPECEHALRRRLPST
jgi:nicotinamide riboside kinase